MRRPWWQLVLVGTLFSVPAFADYGGKPSMPVPENSNSMEKPESPDAPKTPRQQAEAYYRDAYDDVQNGAKELADGKGKPASKHFSRALERSRHAVELDSTYYQAWNLVGFTSRKLGDYPGAFSAYLVALRIKPDFGLAREYYGEGLLETGDVGGAMQQLSWLKKIGELALADELQKSIASYQSAHGDSTSTASGSR